MTATKENKVIVYQSLKGGRHLQLTITPEIQAALDNLNPKETQQDRFLRRLDLCRRWQGNPAFMGKRGEFLWKRILAADPLNLALFIAPMMSISVCWHFARRLRKRKILPVLRPGKARGSINRVKAHRSRQSTRGDAASNDNGLPASDQARGVNISSGDAPSDLNFCPHCGHDLRVFNHSMALARKVYA